MVTCQSLIKVTQKFVTLKNVTFKVTQKLFTFEVKKMFHFKSQVPIACAPLTCRGMEIQEKVEFFRKKTDSWEKGTF